MLNILLLTSFFVIPTLVCSYKVGGGKKLDFQLLGRNWTTSMKGLAIMLIMLCHCSSYWGVYYTPLGGIGVAIFLILSGYGLNESYKQHGLDGFWPKRIGRMMVPYALTIGVFAIACGCSFWWFLQNILCIKTYYWFIAFMMYWYIIFYITSIPILYKHRLPLLCLLSVLCFFFVNNEQAFSFTAGIMLSQYKNEIQGYDERMGKRLSTIGVIMIGIAFTALAIKQIPDVREASNHYVMQTLELILKFCAGMGAIIVLRKNKIIHHSAFLTFTGVISYELYLVHYPFYTKVGTSLWAMVVLVVSSYISAWAYQKLNAIIFNYTVSRTNK